MQRITVGLALGLVLWFLNGCSGVERENLPTLSENGKASLHSIKSTKLQNVMHDLDNLVFDRFYSEIDRDNMRVRYSKEIAQIISSMSEDIQKIRQSGDELELNEEQRLLFKTLALELEQESENLKKIALEYRTESIRPTLDRMINVCNRCHSQFRDIR